jgi:hypothetical protein
MTCLLPDYALRMARATALGLLFVVAGGADALAGSFRAGAATADITPRNAPPEAPSIVAGGFLEGRADRVHDPLLVRAIVLEDGGAEGQPPVRLALVVVDTCMMPQSLIDEAKKLAAAQTGIPVERIMVSATHTHSAPAAMGCLGTRVDAPYAARLPAGGKSMTGTTPTIGAGCASQRRALSIPSAVRQGSPTCTRAISPRR